MCASLMPRSGILFILVGPGGVGKNTIMNAVLDHTDNLTQLATYTTRGVRPGESEGRQHHFVTPDAFRALMSQNALIEYEEVHPDRFYGTPRSTVENAFKECHDLIADVDVAGAFRIKDAYPAQTVVVFVEPIALDVLEARMSARGENPEEIAKRMKRAEREMSYRDRADYRIVNDDLDMSIRQLNAIISGERLKREQAALEPQSTQRA